MKKVVLISSCVAVVAVAGGWFGANVWAANKVDTYLKEKLVGSSAPVVGHGYIWVNPLNLSLNINQLTIKAKAPNSDKSIVASADRLVIHSFEMDKTLNIATHVKTELVGLQSDTLDEAIKSAGRAQEGLFNLPLKVDVKTEVKSDIAKSKMEGETVVMVPGNFDMDFDFKLEDYDHGQMAAMQKNLENSEQNAEKTQVQIFQVFSKVVPTSISMKFTDKGMMKKIAEKSAKESAVTVEEWSENKSSQLKSTPLPPALADLGLSDALKNFGEFVKKPSTFEFKISSKNKSNFGQIFSQMSTGISGLVQLGNVVQLESHYK